MQKRIGQFGQIFNILKFRTMRAAEQSDEQRWSSSDDPRITPVGYYLRKYRIDEVPQFLNILSGEMSLVGPRPEQPELAYQLDRQIRYYREREMVPPGLTGWAQIHYPYGNTVEDARRKLEYDLYYVKNLSISLDLQVVLRTIRTVLFGKEKREAPKDSVPTP
jgi:lipopolysaccharide/colanic/teichoic acid biosynthesis glycosyltransferase